MAVALLHGAEQELISPRRNWRDYAATEIRNISRKDAKAAGPIRAPFIKLVYDTVGAEQILFGADYPHGRAGQDDQFYPMTLNAMNELDVPQADKDKIYYRNATKLFRIS
jgi:predicted TIM-barrel fold metal-dependent hydrolase